MLGSWKICVQNRCRPKRLFGQKNAWSKKMLSPKKYWEKNSPNRFGFIKNLGLKEFYVVNEMVPTKLKVPNTFGQQIPCKYHQKAI